MRFIIPGTCVLLGLSVVGGARPTGPGGTDSSAPSTNSGAASTKSSITAYTNTDAVSGSANSAESRLSQKEILDLTVRVNLVNQRSHCSPLLNSRISSPSIVPTKLRVRNEMKESSYSPFGVGNLSK
ncbi:hypothetical protein EV361DRAFT_933775 [Lentinula raphanica]|nr:hypothetical protein EV361DRAFT_933775 [Lentinula raphanica]